MLDLRQRQRASAQALHLVPQLLLLLGAEGRAVHRHLGVQAAQRVQLHPTFQRLQPQVGKQPRQPPGAHRVLRSPLAQLLCHAGQRTGHGAVLLGQGSAQGLPLQAGFSSAAEHRIPLPRTAAQLHGMQTARQLPRQLLHRHAAGRFQRLFQGKQPLHGAVIPNNPAAFPPGTATAELPGHVVRHEIKGLAFRGQAAAHLLHGVRHIRQRVGHRVQPPAHPHQRRAAALPKGPCPRQGQHPGPRQAEKHRLAHGGRGRTAGRCLWGWGGGRGQHSPQQIQRTAARPLARGQAGRRQSANADPQRAAAVRR